MGQDCNISVVGYGKVECDADMLDISFSVSRTNTDTRMAQESVNIVINKILTYLKENGIKTKDITTTPMSFIEKYDWGKNTKVYKGIEASQCVICRFKELSKQKEKIINIIDFVGKCGENINFNQRFYLEDWALAHKSCRELAYNDAYAKAEHYSALAKKTVKDVKNISEYKNNDYVENRGAQMEFSSIDGDYEDRTTNFSVRKVSYEITLYVDFYAE